MIALNHRLQRWRKRDLRDPDYAVPAHYGINAIRQGIGEKEEVREALLALVELGRVERSVFTNGIFWHGSALDRIDVREVAR